MRIIIVGDGKVGHEVASHLVTENHDVVIVDSNEAVLKRSEDALDVLCVHGNGANARTLVDAGAEKADIIIATTAEDEINMLSCLIAKRLGTACAIARIRDPEYNESLTLLQQGLGIDLAVNPERATAMEISRILRFPFANNIETFAKGRAEMIDFRARLGDGVSNLAIRDIYKPRSGVPQVLFAAVERGSEVIIPNGDFVILPGDKVHITGDSVAVTAFIRHLGKEQLHVKNAMILGGGKISYYLAKTIIPLGIHSTILEIREEKANELSEALPEAYIVHGDGTDQDLLTQENIQSMDAFIALSDRDEENIMTGLYAIRQDVPKVVIKNNRASYTELISDFGINTVVSPKEITSGSILRYVRARVNSEGTRVEKLYKMMNNRVEAVEFIIRGNEKFVGIPIKKLRIIQNTLIAVIVRRGKVFVPFGNDHLEGGDSVVIITRESGIEDLNEVLRA